MEHILVHVEAADGGHALDGELIVMGEGIAFVSQQRAGVRIVLGPLLCLHLHRGDKELTWDVLVKVDATLVQIRHDSDNGGAVLIVIVRNVGRPVPHRAHENGLGGDHHALSEGQILAIVVEQDILSQLALAFLD